MASHAIEIPDSPQQALSSLAKAAEMWGADFEGLGLGGKLHLPVTAGLRRGLISGTVEVEPLGDGGSRVVFRPEERVDHLHTPAVVILLLSVAGALLAVLWPFYPKLLPVAPFGAVLALGGWFLVVSRLRTSGPDEFLDLVAGLPDRESPPS
ncbi:MAG TPA: hypothetical protein VMW27_14805 [Thermoanaerobaculia bacterium]|nr:hypothetical protein [Thermoanaerobaculia bacterium]